ncbi:MAG: glycosyltransferase family 2 protein [Candidatus Omnitrophica bacterium]|nr:glycosyltransferase family 2 protein [Candidatus Omnitrophota bacterium]MDE2221737.1 glycosyltransferase family 2 protein [Candidatus Omnitrophota bacterium]
MIQEKPPVFLSIVFSFRNEADSLTELVRRTRAAMETSAGMRLITGYEMIYVNDASSDGSLEVLLELAAGHKDIAIINMSRTFGVAPCVVAGLAHAKGGAVVYMDADLQDPPELIVNMLQEYLKDDQVQVVHTLRLSRRGEPWLKLFVTRIGYAILNRYSNVPITPESGDFKLLSRTVVDHVLQFKETKPFIRGIVAWVGFKQAFVRYHREARFAGKSKFFVLGEKVISNFLNSALVNFSSVPLQIASYCGICAIFLDVLFAIHALSQKVSGVAVPGWTALMLVIIFIGGVQLFCIGMIGLYLNSVHEQTKQRPNYIISSTYGLEERGKV